MWRDPAKVGPTGPSAGTLLALALAVGIPLALLIVWVLTRYG